MKSARRREVLPVPFAPINATLSVGLIVKDTSSRSDSVKARLKWSTDTIGVSGVSSGRDVCSEITGC